MKKILIVIAMLPLGFGVYGQSVQLKVDTTKESLQFWGNKIADLLEPGVETRNDSLIVKEEVIQLLKSAELRKAVYPEKYNWPEALGLLQKAEWKKAFWHFINLYHYDTATRNLIISSIMMYDKMIPMDKALLSSFYTYSFADPRACRLKKTASRISFGPTCCRIC